MFRQLSRHPQGELYRMLKTYHKSLPKDRAIMGETCSRVLIIIVITVYVHFVRILKI